MKKIKALLSKEIDNTSINWHKLSNKIHMALPMLEQKYTATDPQGKVVDAKLANALTFPVLNPDTNIKRCYKIIQPKFVKGDLYCTALQLGVYNNLGKPVFIQEPEWFK